MKKMITLSIVFLILCAVSGCASSEGPVQTTPAATETVLPTETILQTEPIVPQVTSPTLPPLPTDPLPEFTEEEKQMLLKIGMAERGNTGCTECIALVMCVIQNRVEADRFGSSIRSVLFAPEQFTPVMDGSYYNAKPNENCYDAYDLICSGWDESQGALYYEWCDGPSWHSQNLHLLFQHCDVRFYD